MQQARGRSQAFIECLPSTTSFNIYNLLWGTGSPTLQRPNRGLERFNPLLKAIQTVYNRAWVGALTCLTEELIFFCLHCTANFPLVTSSILVRSELMRFIVLPKNWLYLRTGGWRQGHLHNVCLNCLQFIKDKVTKTDSNVGQAKLLSFLPSPDGPHLALSNSSCPMEHLTALGCPQRNPFIKHYTSSFLQHLDSAGKTR